ncbi:MAG: hypothetical protein GY765_17140 [bacterium]|nr:hypothetical protein [bacterium]
MSEHSGQTQLHQSQAVTGDNDGWIKQTTDTSIGVTDPINVESPGTKLLGPPRKVLDATVYEIQLEIGKVPVFFWWQKGKHLFILKKNTGLIYLVSVPDFTLLKVIDLKRKISDMGLSGEGLVVLLNERQEVRIIDPVSLKYKGAIYAPRPVKLVASPNSSLAFMVTKSFPDDFTIIDLKNRQLVATFNLRSAKRSKNMRIFSKGPLLRRLENPAMTNDGKYLLGRAFRSLHRFGIHGTAIEYEEIGPRIGRDGGHVVISPDSKHVALVPGLADKSRSLKGHPSAPPGTVFIYNVNDLAKPVTSYCSGPGNVSLGFDIVAERLYADSHFHQLVTVTPEGTVTKEYRLGGHDYNKRILVHPTGKKMLLLYDGKLLWVVLK